MTFLDVLNTHGIITRKMCSMAMIVLHAAKVQVSRCVIGNKIPHIFTAMDTNVVWKQSFYDSYL